MSGIAIVTDSTSYIPPDLVRKYGLHVAPQILIWGEETLRDGIDIMPDDFYARLKTASVMPTTSQVTIAYFKALSAETGIRYQTLINLSLRDCAASQKKLSVSCSTRA